MGGGAWSVAHGQWSTLIGGNLVVIGQHHQLTHGKGYAKAPADTAVTGSLWAVFAFAISVVGDFPDVSQARRGPPVNAQRGPHRCVDLAHIPQHNSCNIACLRNETGSTLLRPHFVTGLPCYLTPIGFHTFDYARHFLSCCSRVLGLEHQPRKGSIILEYYGRNVGIKIMPTGVKPQLYLDMLLDDPDTKWRRGELLAKVRMHTHTHTYTHTHIHIRALQSSFGAVLKRRCPS